MANAFVYILFIVTVFFRVLILWWGALRLQPQHEQTWAVREPRLRHFHRRRVNAYLAVLAVALLGVCVVDDPIDPSATPSPERMVGTVNHFAGLCAVRVD